MLNKVKIAGLTYDVAVKEHFKSADDERNLWGYCDLENQQITVRESLKDTKAEQVFVHEMLHSIFHAAGYMDHKEDMIQRVGQVLHQVLKDNDFSFLNESKSEKEM